MFLFRHNTGRAKRNYVFEHVQNANIQIRPTHAQSYPGICYPLRHSIVSNDSVSGW